MTYTNLERLKVAGLLCEGCKNKPGAEPHACPYAVEINNADPGEPECNCCEDCEYQCAEDI